MYCDQSSRTYVTKSVMRDTEYTAPDSMMMMAILVRYRSLFVLETRRSTDHSLCARRAMTARSNSECKGVDRSNIYLQVQMRFVSSDRTMKDDIQPLWAKTVVSGEASLSLTSVPIATTWGLVSWLVREVYDWLLAYTSHIKYGSRDEYQSFFAVHDV